MDSHQGNKDLNQNMKYNEKDQINQISYWFCCRSISLSRYYSTLTISHITTIMTLNCYLLVESLRYSSFISCYLSVNKKITIKLMNIPSLDSDSAFGWDVSMTIVQIGNRWDLIHSTKWIFTSTGILCC